MVQKIAAKNKLTIAYFCVFFVMGLSRAIFGPTLPGLAKITQSTIDQISILFITRAIGNLIGSLIAGWLFDHLSGNMLLRFTILILAVVTILVPVIPVLWIVAAVLFLIGILQSCLNVGGNIMLVNTLGREVGPYMNGMHFFFGIGTFLAPLIVGQFLIYSDGVKFSYWAIAALILFAASSFIKLPDPVSQTRQEKVTGKNEQLIIVIMAICFMFFYSAIFNGYNGWLYSYTIDQKLGTEVEAAYITSVFFLSFTVGRLFSIFLASKLKPSKILLMDFFGSLISIIVIYCWVQSSVGLWIGTIGLGFFVASMYPMTITFITQYLNITGKLTGWLLVGGSIGAMLLPWLIGQYYEKTGPVVMVIGVMITIMAGFVMILLFNLYNRKDKIGKNA